MRHPPRVTARGLFALAMAPVSLVAGLLLGAEELVLLAITLGACLVIGACQCTLRVRDAQGRWRITTQLSALDTPVGHSVDLTVDVANCGTGTSMPVRLENPTIAWERMGVGFTQAPGRALPPSPAFVMHLPPLGAGEALSLSFPVPTEHRGVFHFRGARLWCVDSFGLFAQLAATGTSATISVHPVPRPVEVSDHLLQGDHGNEEYQPYVPNAPKRQDNLGDFAGLRPYVPGDRLRLLYWPSLARTGDLMVRDFEDIGPRRVTLVADVRPHLGGRGAEAVLATAAGVGLRALALGAIVELATTNGERIAIGPGPHGDLALLRALAAVELVPSHSGRSSQINSPSPSPALLATLNGRPLVITSRGGANSLPPALGAGHLIIAS
jgi:uncharacterized protein (DUF58 family)